MAELANNVQQQSSTATDPSDAQEKPLETTQQDEQIIESNWDEAVATFDDMELDEKLLRGIYAYGFEKPSAIQQRGIIPILKGYDSIAQAQSGTGKTATFAISILQFLNEFWLIRLPIVKQCAIPHSQLQFLHSLFFKLHFLLFKFIECFNKK